MVKRALLTSFLLLFLQSPLALANPQCRQVFKETNTLFLDTNQSLQKSIEALNAGRAQEAFERTLVLLRLDPLNLANLHTMASALRALHRLEEATRVYERILTIDPLSRWSLEALSQLYGKLKNWQAQQNTLKRGLESLGDIPEFLVGLIKSSLQTKNFQQAEMALARLQNLKGQEAFALSAELQIRYAQGRHQDVVTRFEQAKSETPQLLDVAAYAILAKSQMSLGQISEAILSYQKVLELEPQNKIGLSQLAHLHLLRGESELALAHLHTSLQVEPYNSVAFWNWTMAVLNLKKEGTLRRRFKLETLPERHQLLEIAEHLLRSDYDLALPLLDQLIQAPGTLHPASLLKLKAQIHFQIGRFDQSYRTLMSLVRQATKVDYQVLAALIRIERHEVSLDKFTASPALQAVLGSLSRSELELVVTISRGRLWNLVYQTPEGSDGVPITNSFWNALHSRPIDSQAVRTLKRN